ncbi:MAG: PASTA domain-containing protein [Nocardioidaceae bacterium]
MNRVLAASLALVFLVLGCDATDTPSPTARSTGTASPSPGTPPAAPSARRMIIPDIAGQRVSFARAMMRERGLEVATVRGAGSACVPPHVVVAQRPRAGRRIALGSRVTLVISPEWPGVCGRHLPPASPELRDIGRLFVDYARGSESGPDSLPADTPVDFYIGGLLAKVVPSRQLADRSAWQGCPGEVSYAGRTCPVSLFAPFLAYPGPIAMTSQAPRHPCVRQRRLPAELGVYRSVTLTPDENSDCTSYFAVQLFVNEVHQIVAVNLVMSEP